MNKSIKTPQAIASIKKACVVADKTFDYILTKLKPGVTEKELVREIKKYIKENSEGISFKPIAAFGKNSYEFHHKPNNTKLKIGDFVMLDLGAKINGFCSDITRTVFFGKASDEQKKMYRVVLESQLKALDLLKSLILNHKSISAKEIDKVILI
ncbi:MAG: M24 family metallopeptidase, partial [Patescibacteria group bacterium]|nr:M24 family metallopeptidase [Patescibacteria group bacterium]